jgi:probable HAF family extracellular repeat protein
MSCPKSLRRVPVVLISMSVAARIAAAQFVPIRELDSNHTVLNDLTTRLKGGFSTGSGSNGTHDLPVVWDVTGTTTLPLLSGLDTGGGRGVDANGTVVGFGFDSSTFTNFTALIWVNGVVTDVNTLVTSGGPATLTHANDLDEHGRIALEGIESGGHTRAYLLDQGALVDLAALDPSFGGGNTSASAMNDRGVVVGVVDGHACVFANGLLLDLNDPSVMHGQSQANDVNRDGFVVGFSGPSIFFSPYAFLYDGSKVSELATSPASNAIANAINDFGVVVGNWFDASSSRWHACLWDHGTFVDLNTRIDPTLGWELQDATDIDDAGNIIGFGLLNGAQSAYILEPGCLGTFTTYGTGCAGTGGVEPVLRGAGCPAPDRDFALEVVDGLPGAFGLFCIGAGQGSVTVKPGCDLQVLPLIPPVLPVILDSLGSAWASIRLPTGTPTFDLYLQALFVDPGAAHRLSATKPLILHFE